MGAIYKRIGDRVCYFRTAAEMAAFLNSGAEVKTAKSEKVNNKKKKKV